MSPSTTSSSDAKVAAEITRLIAPFTKAAIDRDWNALLDLCTDDVMFMPPGGPAVQGDAVRPWLDAFPVMKTFEWSIDHVDTDGDLAVIRGPVAETLVIDGEDVHIDAKYVDVLRRGGDGRWRFAAIIWNSNSA
jgi:ketosteroid isomerase-like protein